VSVNLWANVDALTKPRSVKLLRDDGSADWTTLPSLWTQLEQAMATGKGGRTAGGSRYRTPLTIDAADLAADIAGIIIDALKGHAEKPITGVPQRFLIAVVKQRKAERTYGLRLTPLPDVPILVPESLRHLASVVVATTDDDLIGWWAYRFGSWCRQITTTLRLNDDPQPRGIRGATCPTCQATHVTVLRDGERLREPALRIDFTDGMVRAAYCQACMTAWFRGDALVDLADEITAYRPTRLSASDGIQ
jgi:hypothetical protein